MMLIWPFHHPSPEKNKHHNVISYRVTTDVITEMMSFIIQQHHVPNQGFASFCFERAATKCAPFHYQTLLESSSPWTGWELGGRVCDHNISLFIPGCHLFWGCHPNASSHTRLPPCNLISHTFLSHSQRHNVLSEFELALNMRDLGDSCHILAPWYLTSISPTVGCDTSDCSAWLKSHRHRQRQVTYGFGAWPEHDTETAVQAQSQSVIDSVDTEVKRIHFTSPNRPHERTWSHTQHLVTKYYALLHPLPHPSAPQLTSCDPHHTTPYARAISLLTWWDHDSFSTRGVIDSAKASRGDHE